MSRLSIDACTTLSYLNNNGNVHVVQINIDMTVISALWQKNTNFSLKHNYTPLLNVKSEKIISTKAEKKLLQSILTYVFGCSRYV